MSEERIQALESRVADLAGELERLEREPWTQLKAREILLVDGQGEVRGEWRLLAGDLEPRLALYGEGNKPRVVISVTHDGEPTIALVDHHGRARATLGTRGPATFLQLKDEEGTLQIEVRVDEEGGVTVKRP